MNPKYLLFVSIICFISINLPLALAQNGLPVGSIAELYGNATVVRDGKIIEALKAGKIYLHDRIQTASDSLLKIVFTDGTSIEIASESNLEINEYVFNYRDRKAFFKMLKGKIKSEINKVDRKE